MELDKILKLGVEFVSDYAEDFLQVIRKPGLQLRPTPSITEDAAIITTTDSDRVRVRLNPRLVRFLVISIFLGSVVNEKIPGRPPAQQLLVTVVILIIYWALFSAVSHLICRTFGSRITFIETLSACLQVFAVVYLLSSCCGFLWGVIVHELYLASSPLYFRLLGERPIYAYFISQFPLTLAYLIMAMKRVHKFTFQKRSKTTLIDIALPQLEFIAFCLVFLVTTIMIVGISKFNYEVHNIPLEQPEIVSIDSPVIFYPNEIKPTEEQPNGIKPRTRSRLFEDRSPGVSSASITELRAPRSNASGSQCVKTQMGGNIYGDYHCIISGPGGCYYGCQCTNLFPRYSCMDVLVEAGIER
jgi:hypothetical protein